MRRPALVAGILGFLGVALGAFGAHALKGWLATVADGDQRLQWWDTGVRYHVWHALLLALLSSSTGRAAAIGQRAVVVGVVLFSGSLYAMTLSGVRVLGAITPLGGVAFLTAWACFALASRPRDIPPSS